SPSCPSSSSRRSRRRASCRGSRWSRGSWPPPAASGPRARRRRPGRSRGPAAPRARRRGRRGGPGPCAWGERIAEGPTGQIADLPYIGRVPMDRLVLERAPEDVHDALLDAALKEFSLCGYAEASLENILRSVDVSDRIFRVHFGDKAGLAVA